MSLGNSGFSEDFFTDLGISVLAKRLIKHDILLNSKSKTFTFNKHNNKNEKEFENDEVLYFISAGKIAIYEGKHKRTIYIYFYLYLYLKFLTFYIVY